MNPRIEITLPSGKTLRGQPLGRYDPEGIFLFEDEETLTTFKIVGWQVYARPIVERGR